MQVCTYSHRLSLPTCWFLELDPWHVGQMSLGIRYNLETDLPTPRFRSYHSMQRSSDDRTFCFCRVQRRHCRPNLAPVCQISTAGNNGVGWMYRQCCQELSVLPKEPGLPPNNDSSPSCWYSKAGRS